MVHVRNRHIRRLVLVAALATIAVGAIGAAAGTGSGKKGFTLRIGDIVPYTGDETVFGPAFAKAAGLAVVEANKALKQAGITDVKITIEHADTQTTPDGAVAAARKVVAGGATCVLGSIPSAETRAVAQAVTVPAGIPQISPSSTSTTLTTLADNDLLFRVVPADDLQAPALANYIKGQIGAGKTLGLGARNDVFGTGFMAEFTKAWARVGGKYTGPVFWDPSAASFDSEAQQVTKGDPDAYVIIEFPAGMAKVGAALLRTGKFNGTKLFLAGGQPATIPPNIPKDAMDNARGTRPYVPTATKAALAFDKLYKSTPGDKDRQTLEVNNFDGAMLCILAAIAGNSSNPKSIHDNLRKIANAPGRTYSYLNLAQAIKDLRAGKDINYEGVGGADDFDKNGDTMDATYATYKYINGVQTVNGSVHVKRK
jgi:ABC-type branched-subunit amino acid transport system substrate-binding protein